MKSILLLLQTPPLGCSEHTELLNLCLLECLSVFQWLRGRRNNSMRFFFFFSVFKSICPWIIWYIILKPDNSVWCSSSYLSQANCDTHVMIFYLSELLVLCSRHRCLKLSWFVFTWDKLCMCVGWFRGWRESFKLTRLQLPCRRKSGRRSWRWYLLNECHLANICLINSPEAYT